MACHDAPLLNEGSVGSMPLQLLEIGFHVEIHAIEWHDFVVMVARGSWRNYQRGFDLLQGCFRPKGGVVTGRCFSRRVIEGLDWRFWFKDAFH